MTAAAVRFVLTQIMIEAEGLGRAISDPAATSKDEMLAVIDTVRDCLATMQGFADIAELATIDLIPD